MKTSKRLNNTVNGSDEETSALGTGDMLEAESVEKPSNAKGIFLGEPFS